MAYGWHGAYGHNDDNMARAVAGPLADLDEHELFGAPGAESLRTQSAVVAAQTAVSRLARRPGFVAGVAVAWSVLFQSVWDSTRWLTHQSSNKIKIVINNYLSAISLPGRLASVVCLAWIILILQRTHRSQIDWLERMGFILGCVSILYWIVGSAYPGFLTLKCCERTSRLSQK